MNKNIKITFLLAFFFLAGGLIIFSYFIALNKKSVLGSKPMVLGATSPIQGQIMSDTVVTQPNTYLNEQDLIRISAQSFLVYNEQTGQIIAQKNFEQKIAIASLTKLMNALVVYEFGNLDDTYQITSNDIINISPILKLEIGDHIKVGDLFNSMLIGSNNDAAMALAGYIKSKTGQNLIDLMNLKAVGLGMNQTHFSNPVGFDSQYNYSTAGDLEILVRQTQNLGIFTDLGRQEGYKFKSLDGKVYQTRATNKLISSHPEIQAIKTGYTPEAEGAMITEILHDRKKFVVIILGSQDRETDTLIVDQAISHMLN